MKKLAIIIGGSRGLGLAVSQQVKQQGYELIECSRSGEGEGHHKLDLSRRELAIDTVDALFASINIADYQEILLFLNAAVLAPFGPLAGSEPKQWWTHLDINLTLPISIVGCFQRHFNAAALKKTVAFVSSGAATGAMDGWSLYGASKAGVEHFLRCMALEQNANAHPIKCISLSPGIMDTQMQADIRAADETQFSGVEQFRGFHEQGQLVAPALVAENIMNTLNGEFENGSTVYVGG